MGFYRFKETIRRVQRKYGFPKNASVIAKPVLTRAVAIRIPFAAVSAKAQRPRSAHAKKFGGRYYDKPQVHQTGLAGQHHGHGSCLAMLVGATFAWFTDTASTGVNKIQAGKLDVALEMKEGDSWVSAEGKTLNWVKAAAGEQVLWEPGCTYTLPELRVVNNGNLALKYKLVISGIRGDAELNNVIDWAVTLDGAAYTLGEEHHLAAKNGETVDADVLTISGKMQESAGNDYMNKSIDGIAITVVAAQDTVESDSFNNTYDANAQYPAMPYVTSHEALNTNLTLADIPTNEATGKHDPVEVALGNTDAGDIAYSEHSSGYTGKGVMLGSTKLNSYAAAPAKAGEYTFVFKNGTINSAAKGYSSIDNLKDTSVYMLVPGNSDVVFENMTFNGVVSFDIQMYTSPWSYLHSITFKNCTFNGIVVGSCPAEKATFDGCTFNNYTNAIYANNSNPIWWRAGTGYWGTGADESVHSLKEFTFVNNTVTSTRPVKIERIGWNCTAGITILDNTFDISKQAGDSETKNMAINIGQRDNTSKFILTDDGNTISAGTASLYTAALGSGSNQYVAVYGSKVLDRNGNDKVITAMVWKTTTGETFDMKTID